MNDIAIRLGACAHQRFNNGDTSLAYWFLGAKDFYHGLECPREDIWGSARVAGWHAAAIACYGS